MADNPDFYLSSTEGYDMEVPRKCWRRGQFLTENGKKLLLVQIEPKLNSKKCGGFSGDLARVYLAARHVGVDIFAIKESDWPISVHVCSHKLGIKLHVEVVNRRP